MRIKKMNMPKDKDGIPIIWSNKSIVDAVNIVVGDDGDRAKEVIAVLQRFWLDKQKIGGHK
tara:strand:- start:615 stop:797 length:183 start_codon:yes stop_codon:yes gene_type:complete